MVAKVLVSSGYSKKIEDFTDVVDCRTAENPCMNNDQCVMGCGSKSNLLKFSYLPTLPYTSL